jgi:hypothetical protein
VKLGSNAKAPRPLGKRRSIRRLSQECHSGTATEPDDGLRVEKDSDERQHRMARLAPTQIGMNRALMRVGVALGSDSEELTLSKMFSALPSALDIGPVRSARQFRAAIGPASLPWFIEIGLSALAPGLIIKVTSPTRHLPTHQCDGGKVRLSGTNRKISSIDQKLSSSVSFSYLRLSHCCNDVVASHAHLKPHCVERVYAGLPLSAAREYGHRNNDGPYWPISPHCPSPSELFCLGIRQQ